MKTTTTTEYFNHDKIFADVFGYTYSEVPELAKALGMKIRDTECNRAAAETLLKLVGTLPEAAVKAAAKEMLETGLTVAEQERVTELNGSITEWTEAAEQYKADARALAEQAKEKRLKAEAALAKVEEAHAAIAKIYTDADLTYAAPKTKPTGTDIDTDARKAYRKKRRTVINAARKKFPGQVNKSLKTALELLGFASLEEALEKLASEETVAA